MPMFQTDGDWTDLEELIRDKLGEEAVEDPNAVVKKDKGRYTYDVCTFFGFFDPLPPSSEIYVLKIYNIKWDFMTPSVWTSNVYPPSRRRRRRATVRSPSCRRRSWRSSAWRRSTRASSPPSCSRHTPRPRYHLKFALF